MNVADTVPQGESLEAAAYRELREETGIKVDYLEQLYTFGEPGRDPRGRIISVAYFALVRSKDHTAIGGHDAKEAAWMSFKALPKLAFDHHKIISMALERLRTKIRYQPIGLNLLPEKFTISQLRKLYEAILGYKINHGNFRRQILPKNRPNFIKPVRTLREKSNRTGPPAQIYFFDKLLYENAVAKGFDFKLNCRKISQ